MNRSEARLLALLRAVSGRWGFGVVVTLTIVSFSMSSLSALYSSIPIAVLCWLIGLYGLFGMHRLHTVRAGEWAHVIDRIGTGELMAASELAAAAEGDAVARSLQRMSRELAGLAQQVDVSSDAIVVTARELSAGNDNLSSRTEQQASTLEQISSTIEELSAAIKANATHCREAAQLAQECTTSAEGSASGMRGVVQVIERIDAASKSVAEIVQLIEGFAFQTNILALNAAVEAARAGEYGRGFAVVAAEVRALAQRSAQASKDIRGLTGRALAEVQEGTRIVRGSESAVSTLQQNVQSVVRVITQIARSSAEQSGGVEQVSTAVNQLERVTQQNAALVEQAAAATQLFRDETQNLDQLVGRFKIDAAQNRALAVQLVKRGVERVRQVGWQRACDEFDDPTGAFMQGELYIFAIDLNCMRRAYGANPSTRGQNAWDVRDSTGAYFMRNIVATAKRAGLGWEDYRWTNHATGQVELKSAYLELIDGLIVCCGIYKGHGAQAATAARRLPSPQEALS